MCLALIIVLIACFQGMPHSEAQPRRSGRHELVVLFSLFVILADVVLVKLILYIFS